MNQMFLKATNLPKILGREEELFKQNNLPKGKKKNTTIYCT